MTGTWRSDVNEVENSERCAETTVVRLEGADVRVQMVQLVQRHAGERRRDITIKVIRLEADTGESNRKGKSPPRGRTTEGRHASSGRRTQHRCTSGGEVTIEQQQKTREKKSRLLCPPPSPPSSQQPTHITSPTLLALARPSGPRPQPPPGRRCGREREGAMEHRVWLSSEQGPARATARHPIRRPKRLPATTPRPQELPPR
ncbi:hypothetical protein BDV95DRAFT_118745 [Massariosphaeria phaeospora]|uniref:Uncharacterized protein n=1 Tax=Massariosphaeria phaeospora TaxID=100035 RepID=A0A7C8M8D4_9PLEO|nr:hypothetical protein BDV95DRAFT_118745 [Massariosphaeria phaeospora]